MSTRTIPQKLIKEAVYTVNYVEYLDTRNEKRFAYIAVRTEEVEAFRLALQKGNIPLDDYGVILEYGKGEASDLLRAKMEFQYKCDHSNMVKIHHQKPDTF